MIPLALRITNFRSFKKTQVFSFPTAPGLYFMQGVNLAEPRLEANGAGKTTIWDALCWLFFAKTPSGLKAGDVCNWDADKGTCVEFDFCDDEQAAIVWTITRTWKPNTWTLSHVAEFITDEAVIDLVKDKSNHVLDWLKLEFTPFLNCILMAQNQPMFLDLDHSAQAALFSDVMGLDRWLDYSTKASKRASDQDGVSRRLERELSAGQAKLAQIQGQDLKARIDLWQEGQDLALVSIEGKYAKTLAEYNKQKADSYAIVEQVTAAQVRLHDCTLGYDEITAKVRPLDKAIYTAGQQVAVAKERYKEASAAKEDGTCPTCGQDVKSSGRHVRPSNLKALLAAVDLAESTAKELVSAANLLEKKISAIDREHTELERELRGLEEEERRRVRTSLQLSRDLDVLEEQAEKLGKERNPYAELQDQQRQEGERTLAACDQTQRLLDDSNNRFSKFSYWVRGFKEIRLHLIAEALNELELEVNSCVAAKGLVDWELLFQVDRETKGGDIKRGFNVFVRSPGNELPVPWAAWSGGEAQRLRIAAQEGLANLIRTRSGCTLNLEVWDEPSNGLSKQGIQDLLESLEARAKAEQRCIWVVDHASHGFGGFTGGATVTKHLSGSTVEQY